MIAGQSRRRLTTEADKNLKDINRRGRRARAKDAKNSESREREAFFDLGGVLCTFAVKIFRIYDVRYGTGSAFFSESSSD